MTYDNNDRTIFAAGTKGIIYQIKENYEYGDPLEGHKDAINSMVIEQRILFSGSDDYTIILWDLVSLC